MNCPQCNAQQLLVTERKGVEIDYCPQCQGVWLEKDELDKLVALGNAEGGLSSASGRENPRWIINQQPEAYQHWYRKDQRNQGCHARAGYLKPYNRTKHSVPFVEVFNIFG